MINLYLIRHGQSQYNSQGLIQGQRDISLSDNGRSQVRALAKRLQLTSSIDLIITSDLKRASETAAIINEYIPSPVVSDARWREILWGDWEGKSWPEVAHHPTFKTYLEEWYEYRGHGGESWSQTAQRVAAALAEIEQTCEGKRVAVVTHGGLSRIALIVALKLTPRYYPFSSDNTSITELWLQDKVWRLKRLNDSAHLENTGLEDDCCTGDSDATKTKRP